MGGSNEKGEKINKINLDDWEKVAEVKNADIVRNRKTGEEGQMRVIPFDAKRNMDKELQIYGYRKHQNNSIVRCLGAEPLDAQSSGICSKDRNMRVLTERIVKRWFQLPQLTFPETLYALHESLRGYHDLHQKSGLFQVTEQMIGINSQGKVKVWCHENWAYNHPRDQKAILKSTTVDPEGRQITNEKEMVENIIDIIEQRCEEGRFPVDFRGRIHKNSTTFLDAENELERYAKQRNIEVPDIIHPNTDVIMRKIVQMVPIPKTEVEPIKLQTVNTVRQQVRPQTSRTFQERKIISVNQNHPITQIQPVKLKQIPQYRPVSQNYVQRNTIRNSKVNFSYRNTSVDKNFII